MIILFLICTAFFEFELTLVNFESIAGMDSSIKHEIRAHDAFQIIENIKPFLFT